MESALAKSVIPTITSSSSSSLPPSTIYPSFSGQIKPALTLSYSRSTSSSSSSSIISSSIGGTSTSSITSIDDSGDENSVGGYDDNNSSAANKLNQIEPVWQLTIVDGHIRLDSAIQTLDELEMYTRASLRYLSPFKAIFSTEQIYFDSPSISIPLASISFMQRSIIKKPRKKFLTIGYDDSTTYDYRAIADKELIPLYLEKYNVMTGFLHAPTFLKHYHELDDPLDDPLVLAVCVDAVAALRHNLHYTPVEKRHLADYFYTKCKNMLLDMFDDPTLKFESVTITTFLQMFLMDMVIDFAEARRLVTIALLICSELDVAYAKDEMNPVERVLYQRHRLTLAMFNRTIDVVLEDRIDLTASATIKLNTLDDEPETLKQYVAVSNHILEFVGTPFVANVLKRINRLIYGQSCSLRLDDILHFEPLAREWFDGLPPEFRICKDPFAPNVHTLIENNTSQ
ncbi:hypothetical protein BDB00DRAFT_492790 [Zychaea mexicana]|uniref:uncharacterized protein n=1 Tax=Zychaea mexicana TaxID=64656 RepID=UPI0022FE7C9C|nr:uncharacterized protein BDB00DRAFT_492790 [Zychaea mexicana]KAI9491354.1 hypothetical protein BDB00DRAFT_492790 [Zychaea mexicana]